jgi:TRAP-type transport system periplasmic protein
MLMQTFRRRSILKIGAAVALASATPLRWARAAEFNFKLGVDWPADHPGSIAAQAACAQVREATSGRVEVQFFPNNVLGSDTDMLSQIRSGGLELVLMPSGVLSTFVPVAAISNVGFAFSDYNQVWRAMDGDLGSFVRAQVEKSGLLIMDKIWDNGFRQLTTSNRPINSLADVKGLRLRVPVSSIYTSMWQALEASPASANVNELYSALQTKVFDGQENPLANIQFFRLYEVQKYCALTSHMWEGFWLLANRRVWGTLPADLQATVSRTLNEGATKQRAVMENFADSLKGKLTEEGLTFTQPDRAPFRAQLTKSGFYAQWRKQFGDEAWSRLESVSGSLA